MSSKLIVNCPTCSAPVSWDSEHRWRPFCSERCRLIDLGAWADESHRIAGGPESPTDQMDQELDWSDIPSRDPTKRP